MHPWCIDWAPCGSAPNTRDRDGALVERIDLLDDNAGTTDVATAVERHRAEEGRILLARMGSHDEKVSIDSFDLLHERLATVTVRG